MGKFREKFLIRKFFLKKVLNFGRKFFDFGRKFQRKFEKILRKFERKKIHFYICLRVLSEEEKSFLERRKFSIERKEKWKKWFLNKFFEIFWQKEKKNWRITFATFYQFYILLFFGFFSSKENTLGFVIRWVVSYLPSVFVIWCGLSVSFGSYREITSIS